MKPTPDQPRASPSYLHYRHPTSEFAPGAWWLVLELQHPENISLINTRNGSIERHLPDAARNNFANFSRSFRLLPHCPPQVPNANAEGQHISSHDPHHNGLSIVSTSPLCLVCNHIAEGSSPHDQAPARYIRTRHPCSTRRCWK